MIRPGTSLTKQKQKRAAAPKAGPGPSIVHAHHLCENIGFGEGHHPPIKNRVLGASMAVFLLKLSGLRPFSWVFLRRSSVITNIGMHLDLNA